MQDKNIRFSNFSYTKNKYYFIFISELKAYGVGHFFNNEEEEALVAQYWINGYKHLSTLGLINKILEKKNEPMFWLKTGITEYFNYWIRNYENYFKYIEWED